MAGDCWSTSDLRRLAERPLDALLALLDGVAPCSAFRLTAPMLRWRCRVAERVEVLKKAPRVRSAMFFDFFEWAHARRFSDQPPRQGRRASHAHHDESGHTTTSTTTTSTPARKTCRGGAGQCARLLPAHVHGGCARQQCCARSLQQRRAPR